MQIFLLFVYLLCLIVSATVAVISENLVALVLKGLFTLATLTPSFQTFLTREIKPEQISTEGLPTLVRGLAGRAGLFARFVKIPGFDVLEIDADGRLRSLLNPDSPYNGRTPDRIGEVTDVIPLLILDRDVGDITVDSPGPILLTLAHRAGRVRSRSVVILVDGGTIDGAELFAPVILTDRLTTLTHVTPGSVPVDLIDALNLARAPMLKALRGEALVPRLAEADAAPPPRRSVIKHLWRAMDCRVRWTSVNCRWNLSAADLQVLLDQSLRDPAAATKSVRVGPARVDVRLTRVRALVDGHRAGVKFDLHLTVPEGMGPFRDLLRHPLVLRNATAWTDRVDYDPATGDLSFAAPTIGDLELPYDVDPTVRGLILNTANGLIKSSFGAATVYNLKQRRTLGLPLLWWLLRALKIDADRMHVHLGVGRCEGILDGNSTGK